MSPSEKTADVIVAGAGPAGSAAAITLAAAGARVLVLDRAHFPREKTCGDGLTAKCLPLLRQLGVLEAFLNQCQMVSPGYRLFFSDGSEVVFRSHDPQAVPVVCMMTRRAFDALLLEKALSAPSVRFEAGWKVTGYQVRGTGQVIVSARHGNRQQSWQARLVIDACGAHSPLARQHDRRPPTGEASALAWRGYFEQVHGLDGLVEFYFDRDILPGYLWIFPTSASTANVGCGSLEQVVARRGLDWRSILDYFVHRHPQAAARLRHARLCGAISGGRIPLAVHPRRSRVSAGYLRVGDAAAFCDPITAEGIYYALESGVLAGRVAAEALAAGDLSLPRLRAYDRLWRERFARTFGRRHFFNPTDGNRRFRRFLLEAYQKGLEARLAETDPATRYELAFRLKSLGKMI